MEPIAVTGFSFRLPQGAEDESTFWDMLQKGRNVMTEWPETRANIAGFDKHQHLDNTLSSRGAHFIQGDPATFDAPFFSITTKEAASMDPQQRWMLETTYRALENAGIPLEKAAGTDTAVFAASMADDYAKIIYKDPDNAPTNTSTGTSPSILANRLSWYFDLKGPSVQLNTACSSSLIATDLACQALRSGQSAMAISVACNVLLTPEGSLNLENMNFLSPDSRCYSFDHRANGYARGEGVAALVLKKLSHAIQDGDMIRAVIRASGSNQDGRTPGITQPSLTSQEDLIRHVYKSCNLDFKLTRYIEAHGTGTQLGDSTETKALGRVFRSARSRNEPLYVGSVKANIGHLEGASGLAGILKAIMILEKGVIPPNALFEKWNPKINAKLNNLQVPTSCIPWPSAGLRRISINSFGFGGSNGHIIMDDAFHTLEALGSNALSRAPISLSHPVSTNGLQKANGTSSIHELSQASIHTGPTNGTACDGELENSHPGSSHKTDGSKVAGESSLVNGFDKACNGTLESSPSDSLVADKDISPMSSKGKPKAYLLVWSARDDNALKRTLEGYKNYCEESRSPDTVLEPLAYTLSNRRSVMQWKSFAVVGNQSPSQVIKLSPSKGVNSSSEPGLAFIFTGQGAQYVNMGLDLLVYPQFHSVLSRVDKAFHDLGADWSLFDVLGQEEKVHSPQMSQPLCTGLQIALVELLQIFGIVPNAVVGHSSGEIAAAYTIGALSLESACRIAYHRGRLAQQLVSPTATAGGMISANISEAEIDAYLEKTSYGGRVSVACVNSPFNVTLSGDEDAIDHLQKQLEADEIFSRKLKTGVAYHSPAMRQISEEYLACLDTLTPRAPSTDNILMVSSVTGQRISGSTLSQGSYWVENLVSPVRFSDALQYLALAAPKADGLKKISSYVEVGPHGALRRPVSDSLSDVDRGASFRYLNVLSKPESPVKTILDVAGQLFVHGHPVSVTAANRQDSGVQNLPFLVDAPAYPFDHSQPHWHETRLGRNWRLREVTSREVLGVPTIDWNPLEPQWRKFLRVAEMPWLKDHVIGDDVLFPATGSLLMALEAVKQVAHSYQSVVGYRIKQAVFSKPIVIHDDKDTEVITRLRPLQQAYEKTALRYEVQLFAVVDDHWNECFKSIIHTEYEELPNEVDGDHETSAAAQMLARDYAQVRAKCATGLSKRAFYSFHHQQGLKYGNAFTLADDIYWDGSELAVGLVNTPAEPYEGLVHPAVLDAACQLAYVAPSGGMSREIATAIPHEIRDAWISATGWQEPQIHQVRVVARAKLKPIGAGIESRIDILSDAGLPLCRITKFNMLPIAGNNSSSADTAKTLHRVDWRPKLSMINPEQLRQYCNAGRSDAHQSPTSDYDQELEKAMQLVFRYNLPQMQKIEWAKTSPHIAKYVSFLTKRLPKPQHELTGTTDEDALNKILDDLNVKSSRGGLFVEIARNLVPIVRGEIDASELLSSTSLLHNLREDLFSRFLDDRMLSYLHLAAHEGSPLRILEVGAGSGAMANLALKLFEQIEQTIKGTAFCEYVYADGTLSHLEKARERFPTHQSRMVFKHLDLERDITAQGLQPATFDLILAGDILHTTKDLSTTLQGLRRVLKPGGHLLLAEFTAPNSFAIHFALGVLPNWWRNDDKSQEPVLDESQWDSVLRKNGFSGNDLVIRDSGGEIAHQASIIVSTTSDLPRSSPSEAAQRILLVVSEGDQYQNNLASSLVDSTFHLPAYQPLILALEQSTNAQVEPTDIVVFLADLGKSLLAQISETTFTAIKTLVGRSDNIFWVTSFNHADPEHNMAQSPYPYASIKDGFLRTLRSEFNNKRIISLSLEDTDGDIKNFTSSVTKVFHSGFGSNASAEIEYIVRDEQVLTGRLIEDTGLNYELASSLHPQIQTSPWLPGPPLKLDIGSRGQLDTLYFTEDASYSRELGPMDVEIEAKAWAVNFRDVFGALGRLEEPEFGSDCAGIVTRVGPQCKLIRPGDRVCMCVVGCMRMYPRTDEHAVVKISPSISFDEACAVINPAITAWYSLVTLAQMKPGEKVLIHAGSGATGQMAIQIAQMLGAEVFATVGYDHKKELLINEYGIPSDHIFYSRSSNMNFAKGIMRLTNGYGVDVVLNSLVGEGLRASWECIAPYGRFIEIGKTDINANSSLPMARFANNATFSAVDLRHMLLHRKEMAAELLRSTMAMVGDGRLRHPRPLNIYDVGDVEGAFRFVQSGKNSGRVVIQIQPSSKVQKKLITRRTWRFDGASSYLVAGGLGGIGRSILLWMASRGARNLIVPSRSGPASEAAAEVVRKLEQQQVRVITTKCDLASQDALSKALEEWGKTMPPIRGCINASMALNDSVFDNMTHTQWNNTIRSKVDTTWNLHSLLGDLDFMVLLSSISGVVGNPGQSNYAAGCTFQDSLAQYRTRQGQKTISIDLGVMRNVGVVAESESLQKHFDGSGRGLGHIEEDEFLALLEICCDPAGETPAPAGQIIMGLSTPLKLLAHSPEPPEVMQRPLFTYFASLPGAAGDNLATQFRRAETPEERADIVATSLARKLARALAVEPEDVTRDKPLYAFGVDSLVAVELRNWMNKEFAVDVPVFEIVGGRTVDGVAELVAKSSANARN